MKTKVRTLAVTTLLVAGLGLTGCGNDSTTIKTQDGSVKVDSDGGGIDVTGPNGEKYTAGKGLPDGWPTSDIPVVDGDVVAGSKGGTDGPYLWSAIITAKSTDVETVYADAAKKLTDAGYTADGDQAMGTLHTGKFTSDKFDVTVNVAEGNGDVTVTYSAQSPA